MAKGAAYVVKYRRRREKKTNYKKRLGLLKSGSNRLVVRKSNKHINVQLISYMEDGDAVKASAHSSELREFGWNYSTSNTSSAYLTGLLCGVRGLSKGVTEAVFDSGLHSTIKGSRLYATVKGAVDSGLKMPHDASVFPDESRIKGEHILRYAESLGGKGFEDRFPDYVKKNLDVKNIARDFDDVKNKILASK